MARLSFTEAERRLLAIDPGKWDLTIERLARVCDHLGNPELAYPVILVGGSNGKGSVAAFLTSVLSAPDEKIPGAEFAGGGMEREVHEEDVATREHLDIFGRSRLANSVEADAARKMLTAKGRTPLKVGSFIKPHILSITERVRVDGVPVSGDEFADAANAAFTASSETGIDLTFFELTFLISALHFRSACVDLAICEVGLGGRFDAVNVCRPFLSIITNVGADHSRYLGESAASQAREKAGIIPEGGILVWGGGVTPGKDDESLDGAKIAAGSVIEEEARTRGAALIRVRKTFQHVRYDYGWNRQKVAMRMSDLAALLDRAVMENERVFSLDQLGSYQAANLDCTYFTLLALKALGFDPGEERFRSGLYTTRYRGRFEVLEGTGTRVILDAAHNPEGLRNLKKSLTMYLGPLVGFKEEDMRVPVIFSCQEGKDVARMVKEIAPVTKKLLAVSVPVLKPMEPKEIVKASVEIGIPAREFSNPEAALLAGEKEAGFAGTILVCGSAYSLGAFYRVLE